jgi:hypothetical protein
VRYFRLLKHFSQFKAVKDNTSVSFSKQEALVGDRDNAKDFFLRNFQRFLWLGLSSIPKLEGACLPG